MKNFTVDERFLEIEKIMTAMYATAYKGVLDATDEYVGESFRELALLARYVAKQVLRGDTDINRFTAIKDSRKLRDELTKYLRDETLYFNRERWTR